MSTPTVDDLIAKFEAIPDEKWCVDKYTDGHGRSCALGHCRTGEEIGALYDFLDRYAVDPDRQLGPRGPGPINDGRVAAFQQPTPKARILAALRDVKAKNEADDAIIKLL